MELLAEGEEEASNKARIRSEFELDLPEKLPSWSAPRKLLLSVKCGEVEVLVAHGMSDFRLNGLNDSLSSCRDGFKSTVKLA